MCSKWFQIRHNENDRCRRSFTDLRLGILSNVLAIGNKSPMVLLTQHEAVDDMEGTAETRDE